MSSPPAAAVQPVRASSPPANRVEVVTPEGVTLVLTTAPLGDRMIAFLVDLSIVVGVAIGFFLCVLLLGAVLGAGVATTVAALGLFFLRYGYFTTFELRGRGATPGKRRMGLRVVDATGGVLTGEAVVVRNLLRELELFVPLIVLVAPQSMGLAAPGSARVGASLWAVALALFPLFNRRHLRIGDLLAGTMVISLPKAVLLADVGRSPQASGSETPPPEFVFTDAQLDVYGEFELRVLESVLRAARRRGATRDPVDVVAGRIATKIGCEAPPPKAALAFLRAYYTALRGRLERRMLLGRRKADKRAR